ncbi:MAG: antibiotic biosynthesis monooxygenase [Chloroflexi bacterium]|nr:antibiotic biosynthesis monooxygenase [Chloroflexota bacterium]
MFMRVTRLTPAGPIDEALIAQAGERLAAAYGYIPGYLGYSVMLDRANNEANVVTYWTDAESMLASEEASNVIRERLTSEGNQMRSVRQMELVIQDSVTPARSGSFARISHLSVSPERLDELITETKEVGVPAVKGAPGFQAFLVTANRQTGEVAVSSVWESAEAREASKQPMSAQRQHTMEHFGATFEGVDNYEIVAVDVRLPAPAAPS